MSTSMEAPKKTLEELLAARAAREAKAQAEREAAELLVLELEDKYSTELGPRGKAFQIVNANNDLGVGPIVIKLGTPLAMKAYNAATDKLDPAAVFSFVAPSVVYPAPEVFKALAVERPVLALRCVIALRDLYGDVAEQEGKKY